MSMGERQVLIEHSSGQLLRNIPDAVSHPLPFGMQFLSKLACRSSVSNIPLHMLTDFITHSVQSKYNCNVPLLHKTNALVSDSDQRWCAI